MKQDQKGLYYVEGIPIPETPEPGKDPQPWRETRVVGHPVGSRYPSLRAMHYP